MAADNGKVEILVPPGPLGLMLEADYSGCAAVVKGFRKMPTGSSGTVERHGGVKPGSVIVAVNGTSVSAKRFGDLIDILGKLEGRSRRITFQDSRSHYRARREALDGGDGSGSKSALHASVIDSRVVRVNGKAKYAEYKVRVVVTSRSRLKEGKHRWDVWRRYNEFHALDKALRKDVGWQMKSLRFPPKRTFFNLDDKFIETRRVDLDKYLVGVLDIRGVTEFDKHFGSKDLKHFIDYDKRSAQVEAGPSRIGSRSSASTTGSARSGGRRNQRRQYTRRSLRKKPTKSIGGSRQGSSSGSVKAAGIPASSSSASQAAPAQRGGEKNTGATPPAASSSDISPEFTKYFKLLKIGMTADQVAHRMAAECPHLDPSVIYERAGATAIAPSEKKRLANTGAQLLSAAISSPPAPPPASSVPKMGKAQAKARGGLLAAIRKGTSLTQMG